LTACLIGVVILFGRVLILSGEVRGLSREVASLKESLERAQTELAAGKESRPGLGEFMTTMQLHTGKLWFAAKASNWDLADYELDELREAMEGAKSLHAEKNRVNISNVLDSVLQTQIVRLAESTRGRNPSDFQKAYDETLRACNGCHEESGRKFINIVRPTIPPVSNQRWQMAGAQDE
jgi:hypothetical protein